MRLECWRGEGEIKIKSFRIGIFPPCFSPFPLFSLSLPSDFSYPIGGGGPRESPAMKPSLRTTDLQVRCAPTVLCPARCAAAAAERGLIVVETHRPKTGTCPEGIDLHLSFAVGGRDDVHAGMDGEGEMRDFGGVGDTQEGFRGGLLLVLFLDGR
jgi:hypothetical protein